MSDLEELRRLRASGTKGPWRVRRATLDRDRPDDPPACYGIAAGTEEWRDNAGWFHPLDARYPVDEIDVVTIGMDRDYSTPEAAIAKEADAALIVAAVNSLEALLDVAEALIEVRRHWSTQMPEELLNQVDAALDRLKVL